MSDDETDSPAEESPHERMEQYVDFADRETAYRRKKRTELEAVGTALATAVEDATVDAEVGVEVASTSADGRHQTLRARLDRAALVAAVTESLPAGFVVQHVNEDGTLTVEWDERDTIPEGRKHGAILKAIVAEKTVTDEDGFVLDVPSREAVLERATTLGVPREGAERRLEHLADLDVIDMASDGVYPDTNFGKF